ncbi:hypothetical protein SASPL_101416 [Salvia splendens]|uniref:Enhancer of rudimentary homolog n=1 Tax=Salvia splendens TaxID=180675 RepID=A0A8X8YP89_SALSN|nr:hypothetical protein SASPL_101416 [Salvia splendens]
MSNRHTIILMQTSQHRGSRTFMDYESISQAMDAELMAFVGEFRLQNLNSLTHSMNNECWLLIYRCAFQDPMLKVYVFHLISAGICGLYERKLKDLNPAIRNITYDISDLYNFIDGLADLSALVYDHSIQAYLPYDRQWIKQKTLQHLKKLAQ